MKWFSAPPPASGPIVLERIRSVEVPVLTELKRRLAREEVESALLYAYPQVVDDLARAYVVEIPIGLSHEEIVGRVFNEAMRPQLVFFERLYRWYAPVRYGHRAPPAGGEQILETVQSLYAPEPMWRLYVTETAEASPAPILPNPVPDRTGA